jgi:transposase
MLTGGQVAVCKAEAVLIERMSAALILHGDKGTDSNAMRGQVEGNGAMPNIPPKTNRRWRNCFSPVLCRGRNAIERMFCLFEDFRRAAVCRDRIAVCVAATAATGYDFRP